MGPLRSFFFQYSNCGQCYLQSMNTTANLQFFVFSAGPFGAHLIDIPLISSGPFCFHALCLSAPPRLLSVAWLLAVCILCFPWIGMRLQHMWLLCGIQWCMYVCYESRLRVRTLLLVLGEHRVGASTASLLFHSRGGSLHNSGGLPAFIAIWFMPHCTMVLNWAPDLRHISAHSPVVA